MMNSTSTAERPEELAPEEAGATACSTLTESPAARPEQSPRRVLPYVLDPAVLPDHIDALYRAAWALCGSRADAEDLVQTTFLQVLMRPRIIRHGNARGYLLRALRNTYATRYRTLARHPIIVPLLDDDAHPTGEPAATVSSRELMEAVASAPPLFRDAVIAVDILGLSYREAAHSLHTREDTVASRVHRGRQHVADELIKRGI